MSRLLILSFVCLGFSIGCGSSGTTVTPPEKFSEPGQLEVLGGAGDNTAGATAPAVKPPPSK
ncbi:MAG: hypothetical protein ACK449_08320 [Planctomycetota bacterium]|jgi:hypothetical protein